MKLRINLFSIVILLTFSLLVVRLFYWQVIKAKELSTMARKQYQNGQFNTPPRGDILDSDGNWLAKRVEGYLLFADMPNIVTDKKRIAEKLSEIFTKREDYQEEDQYKIGLEKEEERIYSVLDKKGVVWSQIKKKIDEKTKKEIEDLGFNGLNFEEEDLRAYPEGSSSAHLLGFVGNDEDGKDKGYFGLEGFYDLVLSGRPGFTSKETDALGIPISIGEMSDTGSISGVHLLTHIKKPIQLSIEKKLRQGIEKYQAKSGLVAVMDPKDGAILAMASYPSYDQTKYSEFSQELYKNPIISNSFEPGSIFKVIIMASALDAFAVEPDTKCDICDKPLKVDKYFIGTWNDQYYPDSTMTDVIVHSDNVGMAYVGQKLGIENMYNYLTKFGIGTLSGIDLQGEITPKLREKNKWNIVDQATITFGQGIAVTPIQILKAVGAIANKGVMVTPQVVDKLKGVNWTEDIKADKGERIISQKAADQMTQMMVQAAASGEAKWTYLRGFKVAGKTGTAQIPIAGHYDAEKTIASFVGFAPYNKPDFVMLVLLQEPETSTWASETAAPLWYDIAKDLFLYFGIKPEM